MMMSEVWVAGNVLKLRENPRSPVLLDIEDLRFVIVGDVNEAAGMAGYCDDIIDEDIVGVAHISELYKERYANQG
jgi:hypothetical protein